MEKHYYQTGEEVAQAEYELAQMKLNRLMGKPPAFTGKLINVEDLANYTSVPLENNDKRDK